jgi:hypothetical protein
MPRLVRRKPLAERVSAMLNPMDYLLWLSEELETRDWNSDMAGTQLGLGMNFILLLCRANTGKSSSSDDIFHDDRGSGWLPFFVRTKQRLHIAFTDSLLPDSPLGLGTCVILGLERFLHAHPHPQIPSF